MIFYNRRKQQKNNKKRTISYSLGNNTFQTIYLDRHFTVKTDHRALPYLFSMVSPSSKLTRIRLELEEYNLTVEYLKSKDNYVCSR